MGKKDLFEVKEKEQKEDKETEEMIRREIPAWRYRVHLLTAGNAAPPAKSKKNADGIQKRGSTLGYWPLGLTFAK